MIGGAGNDVYFVDDAGDVVNETTGLPADIDRVESDVSFVLGAGVENLDLNNNAPDGTGNDLANIINGNDAANQILGGGGNDTLNGADGNDVIDGGLGNNSISGGDDNDTVIGGAGNDTIDVGGGFNTLVYNAANFGGDVINSFDRCRWSGYKSGPHRPQRARHHGRQLRPAGCSRRGGSGGSTIITIRENGPASTIQGTIQINGSNNAADR